MPNLDYDRCRKRLEEAFAKAESCTTDKLVAGFPKDLRGDFDRVFASATQSYREMLLGCVLAKLDDSGTDIMKPYSGQSPNAFSGRTLDQSVINPFLHEKRIPSTKGPYLATIRRNVDFSAATRSGLRDKAAYDSFLRLLSHTESVDVSSRETFLVQLLTGFLRLREDSSIPIAKLNRVSLAQYEQIIAGLLGIASGGRIPVMLVLSLFHALKKHFGLNWTIECQGINESDAAKGAGGDITIREGARIVLVGEVTERIVDKARVISTFNTKISPAAIEDYVFFVKKDYADEAAIAQAQRYFAQGSEVNFVDIRTWLSMSLVTMGKEGRAEFNLQLGKLLDADETPRSAKVAWNDLVTRVTTT